MFQFISFMFPQVYRPWRAITLQSVKPVQPQTKPVLTQTKPVTTQTKPVLIQLVCSPPIMGSVLLKISLLCRKMESLDRQVCR